MRYAILGAGILALACKAAFGQTGEGKLEFEVASVKPAALLRDGAIMMGMRGGPGTEDPGRVTYTGLPLRGLLTTAYNVKPYQLSGPGWLDTERFDIVAKIPEGTTKEQFRVMLQNLLTERFKLTLHHETKDLPLYELTVGKNGPKLKKSVEDPNAPAIEPGRGTGPPPGPPPMGKDGMPQLPSGQKGMMMFMMPGRARVLGGVQPLSALADMLGNQLGNPVVDKTGLTGNYDFTLEFAPEPGRMMGPFGGLPPPPPPPPGAVPGPGQADAQSEAPALLTAIQEQLGLKLEQKKGPLDLVVIDHAEKVPTEN